MSEVDADPTDDSIPPPKKKRKVGFKVKMALLEVIERKRLTDRVDYKAISARHRVSVLSLRQLWVAWKRGMLDLGDPTTPEEKTINARVLHERTLLLLRRYKALIVNGFEGLLFQAEDDLTKGKAMAWQKRGLPAVVRELKAVTDLQAVHEKGYMSALEELMAQRERAEKQIGDSPLTVNAQTQIVHATEEELAMKALGLHGAD